MQINIVLLNGSPLGAMLAIRVDDSDPEFLTVYETEEHYTVVRKDNISHYSVIPREGW